MTIYENPLGDYLKLYIIHPKTKKGMRENCVVTHFVSEVNRKFLYRITS